jgi:hypothetical protein
MTHIIGDRIVTLIDEWRPRLLRESIEAVRSKPTADRWSIAEVIGHLVDSACNNHQRFVRAQQADSLTFPKYDQNAWVIAGKYNQANWHALVGLWYLYNQHIALVIRNIPSERLSTPCTITPYDTCTLQFLVEDYLTHLIHHLDKLSERINDNA